MRIAFLDSSGWDYTVETPRERPVGGSQSALCYLAAELARLGHEIAILNGVAAPVERGGVRCFNLQASGAGFLNGFDILVVLNSSCGAQLRKDTGVKIPMVLWNQHAHDQAAIQPLHRSRERKAWNGIAFVSDWQREHFCEAFGVARDKSCVMRNAVAPAFAELDPASPWYQTGSPPVLAYTSTPFRGLDVLLQAFPAIRDGIPDASLRIYSSMAVYNVPAAMDNYRQLYVQCLALDGAEYVGAIGQSELARAMSGTAALAYPCTFAETSCIAALEAMAAGATVLTTRLGVLPETTGGFARMIDPLSDKQALAEKFAEMVVQALREMRGDPAAAAAQRNAQIAYIRKNYTWPGRAREWESWLSELIGSGK